MGNKSCNLQVMDIRLAPNLYQIGHNYNCETFKDEFSVDKYNVYCKLMFESVRFLVHIWYHSGSMTAGPVLVGGIRDTHDSPSMMF